MCFLVTFIFIPLLVIPRFIVIWFVLMFGHLDANFTELVQLLVPLASMLVGVTLLLELSWS